jgi:hypothetical protein
MAYAWIELFSQCRRDFSLLGDFAGSLAGSGRADNDRQ